MASLQTPLYVSCPHCQQYVEITELNCSIFRHGVYKSTGEQLPPHSTKDVCDDAVKRQLIWGCGKPFKIVLTNVDTKVEICDYI